MLMIGAGFGYLTLLLQPLYSKGARALLSGKRCLLLVALLALPLAKPMEDKSKQEVVWIRILGEPLV
ncbi:hypothetical protein O9992_06410 [Vibrio lentus]|nr:hypothetical protein [Vibrio lentus]